MKRSLSGLLAALLCTSCLGSKEPFIVENEAALPLTNGTVLQKYTVDGDSATYVDDVVLKIEEGRYYAIDGTGRFRVRPIAGTPYLLVMREGLGNYAYGLLYYKDNVYVALEFMSSNLEEYLASRPDEAPKNTRKDALVTYFQSRADLERVIVPMAEQDYFSTGTIYLPIQATAGRQTQPRISSSQQDTQQQPEQPLTAGEAVVGGLIGLGILALLFGGSGEGKSQAEDESSRVSAPPACGQEWKIEPATRPCGREYRPIGQWKAEFWCYTDYNMQIGGSPGVTYCTDGGGTWERSALFDRCNGVEGWCD